jgi:hypothetical protein
VVERGGTVGDDDQFVGYAVLSERTLGQLNIVGIIFHE